VALTVIDVVTKRFDIVRKGSVEAARIGVHDCKYYDLEIHQTSSEYRNKLVSGLTILASGILANCSLGSMAE
jgi:hypothetical protein